MAGFGYKKFAAADPDVTRAASGCGAARCPARASAGGRGGWAPGIKQKADKVACTRPGGARGLAGSAAARSRP
jgi:hypothetical protein